MPADSTDDCLKGNLRAQHATGLVQWLGDPSRGDVLAIYTYCNLIQQRNSLRDLWTLSCDAHAQLSTPEASRVKRHAWLEAPLLAVPYHPGKAIAC